ncbi:MAG: hypothetical protein JJLCMIEE_00647 [Acidimicrobiales bacterium]|nr:hypothetical protein [Acidimicrobiales bacterium]
MQGLTIHLVVYAVVNGLLLFIWVLFFGSYDQLTDYFRHPTEALNSSFWPIYPIVFWGAAVLIHAGAVCASILFGRRARQRRRAMAQQVLAAAGTAAGRKHRHGPQKQWVTAMFTDISSSTPLAENMGDDAWHDLLAQHRDMVRQMIGEHEGAEVGTQGDGFLIRFDEPESAVRCAMAIQSRLSEERAAGREVPSVRAGIHAGEVVETEEDMVGRVVNLAARVTGSAAPGQILVTEPVADQLPADIVVHDCGLQELKGITRPRHLLAVDWRDHGRSSQTTTDEIDLREQ